VNRVAFSNPAFVAGGGGACASNSSSVVALRGEGEKEPLFLIHGVDGSIGRFQELVRCLEPDQPAYGIQSQALLPDRTALTKVEDMARYYLSEVRAVQPRGPYHFLGYSFGGLVAFEMARQLHCFGDRIGLLGMLDTRRMAPLTVLGGSEQQENRLGRGWSYAAFHLKRVLSTTGLQYAKEKVRARGLRTAYTLLDSVHLPIPRFLQSAADINWFAAVHYAPQFFPGRVTVFQAMESPDDARHSYDRWARLAGEGVEVREISGHHEDVLVEPHVRLLAGEVSHCLARHVTRQPGTN